jgi:hypothetical protein
VTKRGELWPLGLLLPEEREGVGSRPTRRRQRLTSRRSGDSNGERSGACMSPILWSLTGGAAVSLNRPGTVAHGPGPIRLNQRFSINSNLLRF